MKPAVLPATIFFASSAEYLWRTITKYMYKSETVQIKNDRKQRPIKGFIGNAVTKSQAFVAKAMAMCEWSFFFSVGTSLGFACATGCCGEGEAVCIFGGASASRRFPQFAQKRSPSVICAPQYLQNIFLSSPFGCHTDWKNLTVFLVGVWLCAR